MATTIKRTHEYEIRITVVGVDEPIIRRAEEYHDLRYILKALAQEGLWVQKDDVWYPPHRIHEAKVSQVGRRPRHVAA